jgi:hypothetical protein
LAVYAPANSWKQVVWLAEGKTEDQSAFVPEAFEVPAPPEPDAPLAWP